METQGDHWWKKKNQHFPEIKSSTTQINPIKRLKTSLHTSISTV